MINFLLQVLAATLGYFLFTYINALIFTAVKADKYEEVLIDKIAKRVVELLKEET